MCSTPAIIFKISEIEIGYTKQGITPKFDFDLYRRFPAPNRKNMTMHGHFAVRPSSTVSGSPYDDCRILGKGEGVGEVGKGQCVERVCIPWILEVFLFSGVLL